MKELKESNLEKMKIPERLSQMILSKIHPEQAKTSNKNTSLSKKESNKPKIDNYDYELDLLFESYKKDVIGNEIYQDSLDTLGKILSNIVEHSNEEKFRKIKLSNNLFVERIRPYPSALKILKAVNI